MQSTPVGLDVKVPFRSSLQQHEAPVTVTGAMPEWLRGQVVRTAPAVFSTSEWLAGHWFDGLGMLYAFRFGANGAVTFRQRQLESEISKAPTMGVGFGTRSKRSLWARLLHPTPEPSDNTNVNIVPFGDELVALTETSLQSVIDPVTLETKKYVEWDASEDELNMIAHPHFDFDRGVVVNVGTVFGRKSALTVFEHAPNGRQRKEIGRVAASRVPYTHSFGLTPKHAVLISHPLDVSPLSLLFSNKGYIDHFKWRPEQGTRFSVIDRATGAVREHCSKAFFTFHTVNAYEEGDTTVLDVVAYDDASIIQQLSTSSLANGFPALRSKLVRARLTKGVEQVELVQLSDTMLEFPIINYRRFSGQQHQRVWGAAVWSDGDGLHSKLVNVEVASGQSTAFEDDAYIFGEPVFVGRPGATNETDGMLLAVGSHRTEAKACLQVVNAQTMSPIARATVPVPLPLGFHGSFLRDNASTGVAAAS